MRLTKIILFAVWMPFMSLFALQVNDSKWSLGVLAHNAMGGRHYGITGEVELMVSKQIGITAGLGGIVQSSSEERSAYFFSNGINTHFFPESRFDIYIGGRGALTTLQFNGQSSISPTINLYLGMSLFYSDRIFTDIEFGYAFYGFGRDEESYRDHSSLRGILRAGLRLDIFH